MSLKYTHEAEDAKELAELVAEVDAKRRRIEETKAFLVRIRPYYDHYVNLEINVLEDMKCAIERAVAFLRWGK